MKHLLKRFWHYKPFWKWYCRILPILALILFIIFWAIYPILEEKGIIKHKTQEEIWESL